MSFESHFYDDGRSRKMELLDSCKLLRRGEIEDFRKILKKKEN